MNYETPTFDEDETMDGKWIDLNEMTDEEAI